MKRKFVFLATIVCAAVLSSPINVMASYKSELTGLQIGDDYRDIRPIAVMIDNEQKALPHSSAASADIVYEMMNSTANGRITRLMCIYKMYNVLRQIGSIRSVRPTHIPIAAEYNAILIHEGGPEIYISTPLNQPWISDIDGGFSRLQNNKALEFTEFIVKGEVEQRAKKSRVSLYYNNYKPNRDSHFSFSKSEYLPMGSPVSVIDMSAAYPHTRSKLIFNPTTQTYDYLAYDELQADYDTGEVMTFKNVILQFTSFRELDANGYMQYDIFGYGEGMYLSNGLCVPVRWEKWGATDITRFYEPDSNKEIEINPGKTYINIYPKEFFNSLLLQ